jgi:hypothetical protein
MSSFRQIDANRRNAQLSTGPVSEEGKKRSRRNALRHGLTAETVIDALEDAEDYAAFEMAVTADYDAQSAVERELVLRLASVLWRLRRATARADCICCSFGRPDEPISNVKRSSATSTATRLPFPIQQSRSRLITACTSMGNHREQAQTSSTTSRGRTSDWRICRPALSIASAATRGRSGVKLASFCSRWDS